MKQSFSIDCVFCHKATNLKFALHIVHNCIIILILASMIENHFLLKMSRQIE